MREGFDCEVVAGLLESGRTLAHIANAAAIIAGVCYWYRGPTASSALLFASMFCWVMESWFAVRVAIDRSLFRTLAQDPEADAARLDALLADWKLIRAGKSRSMSDRIRGALRLSRMQSAALILQLVALAIAVVLRAVNL